MLNSVIFDTMMGRLGRRESPLLRGVCIAELGIAMRELERAPTKPWFLEGSAAGALVVNQGYIDLPADFLMEIEGGALEVQNSEGFWTDLVKVPRDRLRKETKNATPAIPEGYSIWGNRFLLGPAPDLAYNYRFDYFNRTTAVADNGSEATNPWITEFFDYVTYKALIVVVRDHIREQTMAGNFADAFKMAEDRFQREVEGRLIANETLLSTDEES